MYMDIIDSVFKRVNTSMSSVGVNLLRSKLIPD